MGAWNMDAIAPAEAQAMSRLRSRAPMCSKRLTLELIAAPLATAGPNNPTEPPNPTVSGAVTRGVRMRLEAIIPFLRDRENKMEETACSSFSLCTYFT